MIGLVESDQQHRPDQRCRPKNKGGDRPHANTRLDGRHVSNTQLDSTRIAESIPTGVHKVCCAARVGGGQVARANSLRARVPRSAVSASRADATQRAGSRRRGGADVPTGSVQNERITRFYVDECGPGHSVFGQNVRNHDGIIVDGNVWCPQHGPHQSGAARRAERNAGSRGEGARRERTEGKHPQRREGENAQYAVERRTKHLTLHPSILSFPDIASPLEGAGGLFA